MEKVQKPKKSFEQFSVSTFDYKIHEYKVRIPNVSSVAVYGASMDTQVLGDGRCCVSFESQPQKRFNLEISFYSQNKYSILAMHNVQILSGKGKLISKTQIITKNRDFRWQLVDENLTDLIDDDDSLTVLCKIKMSVNLPSSSLVEALGSMISSGNHSDVTLVCSDSKELKSHRAILAARSPVFAAMFRHSMKEKLSGRVVVSDVDSQVMKALLDFIYTDQIPSVSSELTYKLLVAADKYNLARLKAACEQHILEGMNIDNACSTLVAVAQLHQSGLKQRVLRFMKVNIHSIISTKGWAEAILKCPQALSELSTIE